MQAFTYDAGDFGAFLATPQKFDLDLSEATLDEVIDSLISYKTILNPKAYKQYSCLKNQLRGVQQAFQCTLMPQQVTDIFWSHFIAYQVNVGAVALFHSIYICFRSVHSSSTSVSKRNSTVSSSDVATSADISTHTTR